jgi:hypothetical protein
MGFKPSFFLGDLSAGYTEARRLVVFLRLVLLLAFEVGFILVRGLLAVAVVRFVA